MEIIINVLQSISLAFLTLKYSGNKKLYPSIILAILLFLEVTFFNNFYLYEGFFSFIYSFTILIFIIFFGNISLFENVFIVSFTNLIISIGNETMDLMLMIITQNSFIDIINSSYIYIIGFGSTLIMILILISLIKVKSNYEELFNKNDSLLMAICLLSNYIVIILEKLLFSNHSLDFEILLSILFVLVISIMSLIITFKQKEMIINNNNLHLINTQILGLNNQLEIYNENQKKISIIKHDMHNYLLILNELLAKKEYDLLKDKISIFDKELSNINVPKLTNNVIIDSILVYKIQKATEKGIKIISNIDTSVLSKTDEMKLAILLGNALDNAIENIGLANPKIELELVEKNDCVKILVKNSTNNNVKLNNPNFITNKEDKSLHGYGLASIKMIISQLKGYYFIDTNDSEFILLIMIPFKK